MSESRFEHFRNDIIGSLSTKLDAETLGMVLASIDLLSARYDVIDRETALVPSDDTIKQTAALYLCCMRQDGKAKSTINAYSLILKRFCEAMHGKTLADITTMDIRRYLLSYQVSGEVSNATVEHVRVVISGFFHWMQDNDYITANPCRQIKQIKHEKKSRTAINGEDVARLRNACKTDRDRVIVEVLVGSGLRVSELANLKVSDINFRDSSMTVLGKGNKRRTAYLTPDAMVAIKRYISNDVRCNRNLIIKDNVTATGVTSRTIERVLNDICTAAEVETDKKITPHVLRHTFATNLVQHGCPVTSLQKMLGHSSISTSMVYAHMDDSMVKHDFLVHSAL